MSDTDLMTIFVVGIFVMGCATPTQRIDAFALANGLDREIIEGRDFRHVVYTRHEGTGTTLVVFLEGDGAPWFTPTIVSLDPTPTNPLMLRLLTQTKGPVAYVGRPCYLGLAQDTGCEPRWWTSARYNDRVVSSMANAIKHLIAARGYHNIALIGHSGGGVLAMLLAHELGDQVRAVITLAANLDTDSWATYHGYTPLADSRNPAMLPALPQSVYQAHFVAAEDRIVPPHITREGLRNQPQPHIVTLDHVNHANWEHVWPRIENIINRGFTNAP